MSSKSAVELKNAMLEARARVPEVQAAMGPVELLERQLGEYADPASSLLDAFTVALNISDKHPDASRPFEADARAAGFGARDRDWAAKLLLGAEVRRGLLSYRIAGLTPREPESRLAAALVGHLDERTREGLLSLRATLSEGDKLPESDLVLEAWGQGLRRVSADPKLAEQASQADAGRFIRLVMGWGSGHSLH